MRIVSFDIETFPDLFTVTAHDCYSDKRWELVIDHNEYIDVLVLDFFKRINADVFVGYNSIKFDAPVINFIVNTENITIYDIYIFSNNLINSDNSPIARQYIYPKYSNLKHQPFRNKKHVDLYLLFNKIDRVSLKRLMVTLNWTNVMDLPYHPGSKVAKFKDEVLFYNHNDTAFTKHLYIKMYDEVKLRFDVSKEYKVDVISSSRSIMGSKLMQMMYLQEHPHLTKKDLESMSTKYKTIHFKDIISKKIHFTSNQTLMNIKEKLENYTVHAGNSEYITNDNIHFNEVFIIGKTKYTMGVGGLHSVNEPEIIRSGNGINIIDADVASFYPNLMIGQGIYPAHLGSKFLDLYKRIVTQRLAAKKAGIKSKAEALKITANSIFGKMGSETEWFFDLIAMYKVTLNGQLFLLMLIEKLDAAGIDVFYGNTDGVTAIVKDEQVDTFYAICKEWMEYTELELEFQEIEKMMLKDVSNYTLLKKNGDPNNKYDVKEKGLFAREVELTKQRDAQIVPKAIHNWFYNNIPIEQTIKNCNSIADFCMTVKIGKQFEPVIHSIENLKLKESPANRVNRYYASYGKNAQTLLKKQNDRYQYVLKQSAISLSNNWNEKQTRPLNYNYYIKRASDIVMPFVVNQTSLF